jgi:UDP-N-acetylmuramate--alanine ligase
MIQNAAGAVTALTHLIPDSVDRDAWRTGITAYRGTRRRGEIVGEAAGILVLDDYAHHPTAIRATLEGFAAFYPQRRLVVDFMSHTYSRTEALLHDFARAFNAADEVVLNDIYPSAREQQPTEDMGMRLYQALASHHHHVRYEADFTTAAAYLTGKLRKGDIFITMGAGDNFRIGQMVLSALQKKRPDQSSSLKGAAPA